MEETYALLQFEESLALTNITSDPLAYPKTNLETKSGLLLMGWRRV